MDRHEQIELDESFRMCPRYDKHELSEEQIEMIADQAARKAVALAKKDLYQGVGEAVIHWVFWIVGVIAVGLFILAAKLGWVKP